MLRFSLSRVYCVIPIEKYANHLKRGRPTIKTITHKERISAGEIVVFENESREARRKCIFLSAGVEEMQIKIYAITINHRQKEEK